MHTTSTTVSAMHSLRASPSRNIWKIFSLEFGDGSDGSMIEAAATRIEAAATRIEAAAAIEAAAN